MLIKASHPNLRHSHYHDVLCYNGQIINEFEKCNSRNVSSVYGLAGFTVTRGFHMSGKSQTITLFPDRTRHSRLREAMVDIYLVVFS